MFVCLFDHCIKCIVHVPNGNVVEDLLQSVDELVGDHVVDAQAQNCHSFVGLHQCLIFNVELRDQSIDFLFVRLGLGHQGCVAVEELQLIIEVSIVLLFELVIVLELNNLLEC